jgi:hypothetical protein
MGNRFWTSIKNPRWTHRYLVSSNTIWFNIVVRWSMLIDTIWRSIVCIIQNGSQVNHKPMDRPLYVVFMFDIDEKQIWSWLCLRTIDKIGDVFIHPTACVARSAVVNLTFTCTSIDIFLCLSLISNWIVRSKCVDRSRCYHWRWRSCTRIHHLEQLCSSS